MTTRRFLMIGMSAFMAYNSALARPSVLGVVMGAKRVHLNSVAVTAGTTVYDGDRFTTEAGGWLRVQSGAAILEVAEESVINVRNSANGAQNMEVELCKGRLVFSAAPAASLNVIAREASIRPASDTRTVARITVTGPKELRIRASRGALQFSYRGETETIAGGRLYRVILDPSDSDGKNQDPPAPHRQSKAFKFIIIGEAAAVVGLGIYEWREPESPDRP